MSLSLWWSPRFIPCTLTLGVQKIDRQLTGRVAIVFHRPIESIAVFKAASGPSGAAFCFVQSSRGCIIKTLNFIEHAEKPIDTWRVFPYIAFRMMSPKMPYVSLGFKRFEIEVGSRSRSGKYLVFWNLKALESCSIAFLLSRASIIVSEFMLKQRLFLKQFSWSSFCRRCVFCSCKWLLRVEVLSVLTQFVFHSITVYVCASRINGK